MDKSPDAFRTISEVAESLETPAHVLRFWESRFPQIKPVKRAGGRRYYRPADVALLSGIRHLLHDEGMTIRGVQKILREQGVRHVAGMAAGGDAVEFDADLDLDFDGVEEAEAETAQVFALDPTPRQPSAPQTTPAEVVQLHVAPELPFEEAPASIPMAAMRPPLAAVPDPAPVKAVLPPEEVPEAGHIWVDDEPELELSGLTALFPVEPESVATPEPEIAEPEIAAPEIVQPEVAMAERFIPDDAAPKMSGIAARLRALPRPVSPDAAADLIELHDRLGLLHAQMAEAQRLRR